MFQYESSREIQVEKDSNATATLETETEFTRDAHAIIRERELKQAAEELKGGESKTGGDEKLYKGINGCTDYKAGFRREQTVGSEKAGESHGPLRASDYQPDICNGTAMNKPRNNQKKKRKVSPEVQFRIDLDQCSKTKDLPSAQALFKSIPSTLKLGPHHYNSFLYICSSALSSEAHDEAKRASAVEFGFSVYAHMVSSRTPSNEATATAMARLAAAKGDGDMAFEMAKGVGREGKLRTFAPALFSYCANGEEEKGYRVEDYMINIGLHLEEPELSALFKVSVEKGREQKIYEYLHKLRNFVRAVDVSTAEIIQSWFGREEASCVGLDKWDEVQVKEAIVKNGGGWHGTGWLGKGKWLVQKSNISSDGRCFSCSQQLVCVDASREETGKFSQSVASLAKEREVEAHFSEFQDWLDEHSDYESIVDGANVGLYQQNFADGGFSMTQLDAVVKEVYNRSKKWPLVVLHSKRVRTLFEDVANRELLEKWEDVGALYATPYGSNDDWYWLYAAVKLKCLLVTNDEMRDHIFELFGSSFFSTWKERHQVRYTFVKGNLKLVMPPPYSLVIQESEKGSWHVPLGGENSDESSRTWLCITRHGSSEASAKVSSIISQHRRDDQTTASNLEEAINKNGENGRSDSSHVSASIDLPVAGKRKER